MLRNMCHSKIHHATATEANLHYVGSITIDKALMEAADIKAYEQVHVVNLSNGARYVTYVIEGERDSGIIGVNGAGARIVVPGDLLIIMSYGQYAEAEMDSFKPNIVFLDRENKIVDQATQEKASTEYRS